MHKYIYIYIYLHVYVYEIDAICSEYRTRCLQARIQGGGVQGVRTPPLSAESYYGNYIKTVSFRGACGSQTQTPPLRLSGGGPPPLSKLLRPPLV